MNLTATALVTLVAVTVKDTVDGVAHHGSFRVVTKDVGATIGVGVYLQQELIHSFYAHTRHPDRAEEITRDLIHETVEEIRQDRGARWVFEYFADRFRATVHERGHNPLDPSELRAEGEA
ncbi:hypothetical protein ACFW2V_13805 [Streptomyces sp. NPDC058947]|uniref:hypothetical protein n=1 Tax=Streptomyces sp. NPDC058947 TaxID=3346675 RepID=UPI0036933AB6